MVASTYIKLFAGLGNQIFQYVYGKSLELNGTKVKFLTSRSKDKDSAFTDFVGVFGLSEKEQKKIYVADSFFSKKILVLKKIYAKYICRSYQTGFYQDVAFVEFVAKQINLNEVLSFKRYREYSSSEPFAKIKSVQNSVAVHIRGGDYLEKGSIFTDICTADYYNRAIGYIKERVPNPHFFIFTNDRNFSDSIIQGVHLLQSEFTYVLDPDTLKNDSGYDLFLMSQCNHNIIANSTYSWWGAWINENKDKIVILPSIWTNDGSQSSQAFKPVSWIPL